MLGLNTSILIGAKYGLGAPDAGESKFTVRPSPDHWIRNMKMGEQVICDSANTTQR